jgi:hypothetical protein
LRTDGFIVRAQSTIRADGFSSAQRRSPQRDLPALRAARANRVFYTDEKRIRIENTVMDKSHNGGRDSSRRV